MRPPAGRWAASCDRSPAAPRAGGPCRPAASSPRSARAGPAARPARSCPATGSSVLDSPARRWLSALAKFCLRASAALCWPCTPEDDRRPGHHDGDDQRAGEQQRTTAQAARGRRLRGRQLLRRLDLAPALRLALVLFLRLLVPRCLQEGAFLRVERLGMVGRPLDRIGQPGAAVQGARRLDRGAPTPGSLRSGGDGRGGPRDHARATPAGSATRGSAPRARPRPCPHWS